MDALDDVPYVFAPAYAGVAVKRGEGRCEGFTYRPPALRRASKKYRVDYRPVLSEWPPAQADDDGSTSNDSACGSESARGETGGAGAGGFRARGLHAWERAAFSLLAQQALVPGGMAMEPIIRAAEGSLAARAWGRSGGEVGRALPLLHACAAPAAQALVQAGLSVAGAAGAAGGVGDAHAVDVGGCAARVEQLPPQRVLVGYQEDWLELHPASLAMWEKAPLEPFGTPKAVLYYALCPAALQSEVTDFLSELCTAYEGCRLGGHAPCPVPGVGGGLVLFSPQESARGAGRGGAKGREGVEWRQGLGEYMGGLWNAVEQVKSLLASSPTHLAGHYRGAGEERGSPAVVVYVVCPFEEPESGLEVLLAACRLLADALPRGAGGGDAAGGAGAGAGAGAGVTCVDLTVQLLTVQDMAHGAHGLIGSLKALAFTVYSKAHCLPQWPLGGDGGGGGGGGGGLAMAMAPSQAMQPATPGGVAGWGAVGGASPSPPLSPGRGPAPRAPAHARALPQAAAATQLLRSPACSLAARGRKGAGGGEVSSIHGCYCWSECGGTRLLLAAWTDTSGRMLQAHVLPVPAGGEGRGAPPHWLAEGVEILLDTAAQVAAAAAAAAAGRWGDGAAGGGGAPGVAPQAPPPGRLVMSRIGELGAGEAEEWSRQLQRGGAGAGAGGGGGRGGGALEALARAGVDSVCLVSVASEVHPVPATWDGARGPLPGARGGPGGGYLLQYQAPLPGGGEEAVVVLQWPSAVGAATAPPGPLALHALRVVLLVQAGLGAGGRGAVGRGASRKGGEGASTPATPAPATPAPDTVGAEAAPAPGEKHGGPPSLPPAAAAAADVAEELHGLCMLSECVRGLCGGRGGGIGAPANSRGAEPVHCGVVERMGILLAAMSMTMS